jgi:hypothetical protein
MSRRPLEAVSSCHSDQDAENQREGELLVQRAVAIGMRIVTPGVKRVRDDVPTRSSIVNWRFRDGGVVSPSSCTCRRLSGGVDFMLSKASYMAIRSLRLHIDRTRW